MIAPEWFWIMIIAAQSAFDTAVMIWILVHGHRHSIQYGPMWKGTD